ncbi:MAG: restriction endonuclease subunit S, partial [Faecalibacterium prausnitzii]
GTAGIAGRVQPPDGNHLEESGGDGGMKWEIAKLGKIAIIRTGKLDSNAAVIGGRYPFFTCDPNTLSIDVWAYDTEAVLLAGNNASGNYTAKYYKGKFNAYQRTYIIESADEEKLNIRYFCYALNQQLRLLKTMSSGSTTKFLTVRMLDNLDIPLPSINIQTEIVNILSAYDDLIENNQKQIKLLEEAAQRLYKEWFVDWRFPGHENTKIVDGVPEGWNEKTLSQVANVIMGQSPKSEFYNSEKKGLPFHQGVGSYGVRFVMDDIYSTSYTRIAEPNSILFSVRAPVGRLNITKNKVVIGRGLAAINQTDGCQSYLYYLLKNRFFKDNIVGNGSIFASVSKDELLNQKFLIPERNLMMQFEKIVSQMDKQIENLDSKNKKLIEARDRLLPKLMSGEVEV